MGSAYSLLGGIGRTALGRARPELSEAVPPLQPESPNSCLGREPESARMGQPNPKKEDKCQKR
jgi:hypothetical protein